MATLKELTRDLSAALKRRDMERVATIRRTIGDQFPETPVGTLANFKLGLSLLFQDGDLDQAAEVYSTPAEERIAACVGRADMVLSINVLDHCYDFESIIRNVRAYLKPDGRAFLSFDSHDGTADGHALALDEDTCETVFRRVGLRIDKFSTGHTASSPTSNYGHGRCCLNYWLSIA